ncbi:MAG: hypothetical protein UU19_C0068G0001, partial [Candidatus Curtissbacteria bacterium GW2011_GWD1_40_8]
ACKRGFCKRMNRKGDINQSLSYQKKASLSYHLGPDVGLVEKIDNINFSGWSWPYATGEKSTLIIGNSVAIPGDYNPKDYNLLSEIKLIFV